MVSNVSVNGSILHHIGFFTWSLDDDDNTDQGSDDSLEPGEIRETHDVHVSHNVDGHVDKDTCVFHNSTENRLRYMALLSLNKKKG